MGRESISRASGGVCSKDCIPGNMATPRGSGEDGAPVARQPARYTCSRAPTGDRTCDTAAMRLHLIDGTFELFRAHYSKRPAHPLKATRGLAQSLLALLANPAEQVTHVAVAFDNPIRSFR